MGLYEVALALINLLFGFRIFTGICKNIYVKGHLSKVNLAKIGTIFVLFVLFLSQFIKFDSLLALFWLSIPSIFLILFESLWLKYKRKELRAQFLEFLKIVHLKMGVGSSFRDAIRITITESESKFSRELHLLYEFVVFSQHKQQLSAQYGVQSIQQLQKIDRSAHDLRGKLKLLIYKLQIEHDFRHRSGQILVGVKMQSYFLVFVYSCSCFLSIQMYGFNKNLNLLLSSLVTFAIGFFWIEALGRKIKWKI